MGKNEAFVPNPEGSDKNRFGRNGQPQYPEFAPDPTLQEVPDTPETRAYHRRVIQAIHESTAQERDAGSEAAGDSPTPLPQEPRG